MYSLVVFYSLFCFFLSYLLSSPTGEMEDFTSPVHPLSCEYLKAFYVMLTTNGVCVCNRSELHEQHEELRQTEREKSQLIDQLTEQNQRLTTQLKEVSCSCLLYTTTGCSGAIT